MKPNLCRHFLRRDKSRPARVLLERRTLPDGAIYHIIGRDAASGIARVGTRASESFNNRRHAFDHPLITRAVPLASIPDVPILSPASISWR